MKPKIMHQPLDFKEFGEKIWDAAMNAHLPGAHTVEVPFHIEDGGMCRVVITPPTYVERRMVMIDGGSTTQWRHGKKMSNGEIEWGPWG